MLVEEFEEYFREVPDPRVERTKKHLLFDIIGVAICGVLAGAQCWTEIADYAESHSGWFEEHFELPHGIPSHDTFARVFALLDPSQFQASFFNWVQAIFPLTKETVIALDGKTMRGSHQRSKDLKALHVVSAWSCANGIGLGQLKVDEKTNEITVLPELIEQINVKDSIITIDAMGCQRNIAELLYEKQANYR
jgi:hypothetical protein